MSLFLPDSRYERKLWKAGVKLVAGCDEVGRGCFAGPVVAAAVVFAPNSKFKSPVFNQFGSRVIINDSKKLTSKQRNNGELWIRENSLACGIGEVSTHVINRIGIKKASERAFRIAVKNCKLKIEHLLLDAFFVPYVNGLKKGNQTPIVKGDSISVSIAAASIVAKVYRDKIMTEIGNDPKYKMYNWPKNKGYGTKFHRDAIIKHGVSKHHRKQFVNTFLSRSHSLSQFLT